MTLHAATASSRTTRPLLQPLHRCYSTRRDAPDWLLDEFRTQSLAKDNFEVTKLHLEKTKVEQELEQAKVVIGDLRYAAFKKEVHMEARISFYQNLQEKAERDLEAMKLQYMSKRTACTAYRFILLHTALSSFARVYQVKKKMRVLREEITSLVSLLADSKDSKTGDLGVLLPQAETGAFLTDSESLWNARFRS